MRVRACACVCVTPLDARFGNLFSKRELLIMWWKTSLVDKLIENYRKMLLEEMISVDVKLSKKHKLTK